MSCETKRQDAAHAAGSWVQQHADSGVAARGGSSAVRLEIFWALIAATLTGCGSGPVPVQASALVEAPQGAATSTGEPVALAPRGLGKEAMCFNARYSQSALEGEDSELLRAECEALGCCRHLDLLEGTPITYDGLLQAVMQSASLGKSVVDGSAEIVFPGTRVAPSSTLESSRIVPCGTRAECGPSVEFWLRRMGAFLDGEHVADARERLRCQLKDDHECAEGALASPGPFGAWYECVDRARPLTWRVPSFWHARSVPRVPALPRQGYVLAYRVIPPHGFASAAIGTGRVLVVQSKAVWKLEIPCGALAEGVWVSRVVPSLTPERASRKVRVPADLPASVSGPHARRGTMYPKDPSRADFFWLATSEEGRARWGPRETDCDHASDYRALMLEELFTSHHAALHQVGSVGPEYGLAARRCAVGKIDSDACDDFERLMKPLWGKQRCPALP